MVKGHKINKKDREVSYTEGMYYNYKSVKTYENLYDIITTTGYPIFCECIKQYNPINLFYDIEIKLENNNSPLNIGWDTINKLKKRINSIFNSFEVKFIVLEAQYKQDNICKKWFGRLIIRLEKDGDKYFFKNVSDLDELYYQCIKPLNLLGIKSVVYDLKGSLLRTIHSYKFGEKKYSSLELTANSENSTMNILETFVMYIEDYNNVKILDIEKIISEYLIREPPIHIPRKNRTMYSITDDSIEDLKILEEITNLNVQIILANFMKIKMINAGIFEMDIVKFYKYKDNTKCFVEFNSICPFRNRQHSNFSLYMCTTLENIQLRCYNKYCKNLIYKEIGYFSWILELINNSELVITNILNRFINTYIDNNGLLECWNDIYKLKLNKDSIIENFGKKLPKMILNLIKTDKKCILKLCRTNYIVEIEDFIFNDDFFSINYFLLKYSQGFKGDKTENKFTKNELINLAPEIELLRKIVENDNTNEDVTNVFFIIIKGNLNFYVELIYKCIKDNILYCHDNFYICDIKTNIWYKIPIFRYNLFIFKKLDIIFENTIKYLKTLNLKIIRKKELMRKLYSVIRKKMISLQSTKNKKSILKLLNVLLNVNNFKKKIEENKHLVPFLNGVIDILTKPPLFRNINKEDCITNYIGYEYRPNIKNKEVKKFLKSILPNKLIRNYLLGYLARGLLFNKHGKKCILWIGKGEYEKLMLYQLVKVTFDNTCKKLNNEFLLINNKKHGPDTLLGMKDSKKKRIAFYFSPEKCIISTKIINHLCTGQLMYGKNSNKKNKTKIILNFKLFIIANKLIQFSDYNNKLNKQINVIEFKQKLKKDSKLIEKINKDDTWKQTFMNILIKQLNKKKIKPKSLIKIKENFLKPILYKDIKSILEKRIIKCQNNYIFANEIIEDYLNYQIKTKEKLYIHIFNIINFFFKNKFGIQYKIYNNFNKKKGKFKVWEGFKYDKIHK